MPRGNLPAKQANPAGADDGEADTLGILLWHRLCGRAHSLAACSHDAHADLVHDLILLPEIHTNSMYVAPGRLRELKIAARFSRH